MPNTEEKDKDKLYFYGESSKLRTFEKHAEDVVAKVGGEVLVDHLHNRQSEDIVRRKAAEQFELDILRQCCSSFCKRTKTQIKFDSEFDFS